ncbi:hypothetical protein AXF42_Ash021115 [Apostasia shenzhenica]|uniref:HTH myb-type domain-containing protein n=1 Tax=Apostasia shenzhenica TaxID=1088818 RepID=A0A2H9ZWV5_9ASPA|nr:hypothetical protein AXF42_Ash021115 [Apostasia shenzhenica]
MSPSTLDEEDIQVDHLLVEPHGEKGLDHYDICSTSKGVEKTITTEGICCNARQNDYGDAYGMLDGDFEAKMQELKYEFLDNILQVAEDENLHMICNVSCDSAEYLFDSGFTGNCLLDCSSNTKHLKSQISLEQDDDCDKSALHFTAKSISFRTPGLANLPLEHPDNHELYGAFSSTFYQGDCLDDKQWLKDGLSFGQQNLISCNVSNQNESGILSQKNADGRIPIPGIEMPERVYGSLCNLSDDGAFSSQIAASLDEHAGVDKHSAGTDFNRASRKISEYTNDVMTTKRLRKPTRRYIEETSEMKPKCSFESPNTTTVRSKDKVLHSRIQRQYNRRGAMQFFYEYYPDRMQSWKGRQRTNAKHLEKHHNGLMPPSKSTSVRSSSDFYYSVLQEDISDDCHRPIASQKTVVPVPRKQHRQWSLTEVVKLVDGVSQYGVGRWSEIKRISGETS